MARKRKYSKEYAEYRYRYQTYYAQRKKNKYMFDEPAMPMLDEEDFYLASEQNPNLSPKELAHKSVYGLTIHETQARFSAAELYDVGVPRSIIRNMEHKQWAELMAPYINDFYANFTGSGMTGADAGKAISQVFFGSE